MAIFLSIPVLGLLVIIQSAVLSRMPLIHGTTDAILVALVAWAVQVRVKSIWQWTIVGGILVNIFSALPLGIALLGYLLTSGMVIVLRRWLWRVPLLAMITATLLGTLLSQSVDILALRLVGTSLPIISAFNEIILPSALLNLLLAIPLYVMIADLAKWAYPEKIEL